jgi:hypothetical protein
MTSTGGAPARDGRNRSEQGWALLRQWWSTRAQRRRLSRAQQKLWRQIAELERTHTSLSDPRGRALGEYCGIRLWEYWITTPSGEGPVDGVKASCDTASNMVSTQRATLTRMAAGGLLLGPLGAVLSLGFQKKDVQDHRELYLLIEAPTFASVVECPAQEGAKARKFAVLVNLAASTVEQTRAARPAQLAQVEADLSRVRSLELAVRTSATGAETHSE